jgi:hypothetical protein
MSVGRALVSMTPEDVASIGAATERSRVTYRVEVDRCSESGRPLVHVESDRAGLTVHFCRPTKTPGGARWITKGLN